MRSLILLGILAFISCDNFKYEDLIIQKVSIDKSKYSNYLIDRELGLHRLNGYDVIDSSLGVVLLHGYYPPKWKDKGFEWTKPMHQIIEYGRPIWWLRYNWFECPEQSVSFLNTALKFHP